jgi:hypothetical protein
MLKEKKIIPRVFFLSKKEKKISVSWFYFYRTVFFFFPKGRDCK